jgi:hypothetical protein
VNGFSSCSNRVLCNFLLELGIYFGKPRGFGKNENGEEIGFNTEVYATHEVVLWHNFVY